MSSPPLPPVPLPKEDLPGQPRHPRMSDETPERHVRQCIEAQTGDEGVFSWQGGEPTILGPAFFRKAAEDRLGVDRRGAAPRRSRQTPRCL